MFAIKNEHIIAVHDLFEENGTAYYVMDYVDGENLAQRQKRTGKPMSEKKVREILPQILDALQTVHDAGIWHLDLKPANIMLDKAGQVKLIDFGASKQLNTQKGGATTSTAISYTNGFAPREQMEQNYDKFGPWTDLYALGATLYNLLTNQRPPLPTDIDDDMSDDKHLALPMPNVSSKMKQLILWLMKTNRAERPQTVIPVKDFILEELANNVGPQSILELDKKAKEEDETKISDKKVDIRQADSQSLNPEVEIERSTPQPTNKGFTFIWLIIGTVLGAVIIFLFFLWISNNQNDSMKIDINTSSFAKLDKEQQLVIQRLVNNMVHIDGGSFSMGNTNEIDQTANFPDPKDTIVYDFHINKYEVTQEEWCAIMSYNPSIIKGNELPVSNVTYTDCIAFIDKLNELTGKIFRLPSGEEWEYAARGGNNKTKFSGSNNIDDVGWYKNNSNDQPHPVGLKKANEFALFDMSGNVSELCNTTDGWALREVRGGSYLDNAANVQNPSIGFINCLESFDSPLSFKDVGFRLAMSCHEGRSSNSESFDVVEVMPSFHGGVDALRTWLSKNIKYPKEAEANGVQGRVVVSFMVEKDGSINDIEVVDSVDPQLDEEAVRVAKNMPNWIPGKQNGSFVRVKLYVPFTFRLE